jgi:hypothetical protein
MVRLFCLHSDAHLPVLFINHRTAALAAEFGKTRKQITTHKCANTWLIFPCQLMSIQPALLMRGSNGALLHLRRQSLASSFRSIGSLTLQMRQISPSFGWE